METTTTTPTETQKKITLTTVKSFMRKNADNLWIYTRSSFDSMIDMVSQVEGSWKPTSPEAIEKRLVGSRGARDFYSHHTKGAWVGFSVSNCCGEYMIAANIE